MSLSLLIQMRAGGLGVGAVTGGILGCIAGTAVAGPFGFVAGGAGGIILGGAGGSIAAGHIAMKACDNREARWKRCVQQQSIDLCGVCLLL
jgi:hypothetical protein